MAEAIGLTRRWRVDSLVPKLLLAPGLILAASLVSRHWGPAVGGWLVALPLTSGPIAFFLALDHGPGFAASTATGSLVGALAEVAFCVAYAALARRGWPLGLLGACLAFAATATILQHVMLPLAALAVSAVVALVAALAIIRDPPQAVSTIVPPRWDLAARMTITTVLVLLITGSAGTLGPELSGVLAMFPVYVTILTVFAHRTGRASARQVLRGVMVGLFSGVGFFIALGGLVERLGVAGGFAVAIGVALVVQASSLAFVVGPAARKGHESRTDVGSP